LLSGLSLNDKLYFSNSFYNLYKSFSNVNRLISVIKFIKATIITIKVMNKNRSISEQPINIGLSSFKLIPNKIIPKITKIIPTNIPRILPHA
jgi:hypothetical protein